ncbi:hypothetical protein [Chitinimonas sp. BJYL2]|uniref:hypothetical protein n=1 Tax=Chitinimonas sp. BJYL2 TaxID=2976696 RepID=UPI0022B37550|nr:hypothetical protein [Chitinimonas sp. BJYL2]
MKSLDLLFPYVVPSSWVENIGVNSLISWRISDDVHVTLVFDANGAVMNARPADLDALNVSEEEAFDIATQNLTKAWEREEFDIGSATLLDGVQIGYARGNWMAPAAGLILGGFYGALNHQFGCTDFAAVAPNQECLFAFPTDELTLASKSLRLAIDDEFEGHPKPISRQWLLLNGQWPRQFPSTQLF